ncbi:hypothetical protein FOL47_004456 [Perkinsus chesapeaki]|uniref:Uncharacterized protein n=1 Tax=Perkinsus chesapeaki TaxID=330153 RepID=A0A7J6M2P8_PERCH|nr:hypothetical protein FOL47_004456 [Perkinsus chesapeaki]
MDLDVKMGHLSELGPSIRFQAKYGDSEHPKGTWYRVIMSLTLACTAIYGAIRIGFSLSVDNIIEAYVWQWRIELRNLEVSPDPATFGGLVNTTACIVSGPEDYVNISFVLSITNNPPWLEVYITSVRVIEPDLDGIQLRARSPPFKGDGEVLVRQGIQAYRVTREKYRESWAVANTDTDSALWLALDVRFSIFGYQTGDYSARSYVTGGSALHTAHWVGNRLSVSKNDYFLPLPVHRVKGCLAL